MLPLLDAEKSAESAGVPLPPRPPGFFKSKSGSGGQVQSPLRTQASVGAQQASGHYGQTSRSSSAVRAQRSLPAIPASATAGRQSSVQGPSSSFKDKSDEPLIPPVQSTFFHNRGMRA